MIQTRPKISVLIVTYNFEKYISECIESILSQTLKPFEIIICDDCSTDNSKEIINRYEKLYPKVIKAFCRDKNLGPVKNVELGISCLTGDWYSFIDGDDCWFPQKLEMEWKALQKSPGAKIAYSNVLIIDQNGSYINTWHNDRDPSPPTGDAFIEVFSKRFFPRNRNVFRNELISRQVLETEEYIDKNLSHFWDWDRKIRITSMFKIVYSGKTLVKYRKHPTGISKEPLKKLLTGMIEVYEKNLPLLSSRPEKEALILKVHIEMMFAELQAKLPVDEQIFVYYQPMVVYKRNRNLIKKMLALKNIIYGEKIIPLSLKYALQSFNHEKINGNKLRALRLYFDYLQFWYENQAINKSGVNQRAQRSRQNFFKYWYNCFRFRG